MAEQVPSIGRIVHFVYGGKHFAAMITDAAYTLFDPRAADAATTGEPIIAQALAVFPPNEEPWSAIAQRDDTLSNATWHWPEYVAPVEEV